MAVNVAVLFDFDIEIPDELFVDWALGSSIVVELDLESLEKVDDESVILVCQLARRNAQFDGLYLDGSAMLVASTDHDDVFAFQSKVARIDIGREKLGEGSQVRTVVDVWPSRADNPSSQCSHLSQNGTRVLPPGL